MNIAAGTESLSQYNFYSPESGSIRIQLTVQNGQV